MLKKLQSTFGNSILLSLVVLPYLINSTINIPFSLSFLWLFLSLILIEIGYQKISKFLFEKYKVDISVFVIPTVILLFYYESFILLIKYINGISVKLPIIRAKYYLPLIYILLIIVYYQIKSKQKGRIIIIHSFFFIFSLTLLFTPLIQNYRLEKPTVSHFIPMNNSYIKPVILLILDEYASPIELFKNNPDSLLFQFSKTLTSSGWRVNNNQFSNELYTINSLSSLFNYNLQFPKDCLNVNQAIEVLRVPYLIRDLEKKAVKIHNFGIFDIGDTKAFSKIYFYENEEQNTVFLRQLFIKSMFGLLYDPLPNNRKNRQLYHNKFIVEKGFKRIKKLAGKKVFIYLHLLMPHSPFVYEGGGNNFDLSIQLNSFENYVRYWRFTNSLVQDKLLDSLVRSNAFKIIITGDHGYRGELNKVNPHQTMTAYYGFESSQISKIKSVQDLGSLIYASY